MKITSKPGAGAVELKRAIEEVNHLKGKVGWFENARYPDNTTVASVAAGNEYGIPSKNVPARSFMRSTVAHKLNNWNAKIKQGMKLVVRGDLSGTQLMTLVTSLAASDIQRTIISITAPPLKESTVRRRAEKLRRKKITLSLRKPLVDTKHMLQTLTYIVSK